MKPEEVSFVYYSRDDFRRFISEAKEERDENHSESSRGKTLPLVSSEDDQVDLVSLCFMFRLIHCICICLYSALYSHDLFSFFVYYAARSSSFSSSRPHGHGRFEGHETRSVLEQPRD